MKLKIKDIKKTSINPRKMSKEARSGLRASLQQFGDISGIVWNKRSGEIVGGNHRWDELCSIYDSKKLELVQLGETDIYAVHHDGEFTSYTVRVVDWDEKTALTANLTANNMHIAGTFTKDVDDLLKSISDLDFFDELKLGNLYFEIPVVEPINNASAESLFNDDGKEDENFLFDDSEFADPVASEEPEKKLCNKAEVTIILEGNIDLAQISNEITDSLKDKYKISYINASSA